MQIKGGNIDLHSARARKYVPLRSFESTGPSTSEIYNDENKVPSSQMPNSSRMNNVETDENEALKRMHK
jgi:hypothetical protein